MFQEISTWFRNLNVFGVSNSYFSQHLLNDKQPQWADVSHGNLFSVYKDSPYLRIVIDRMAEMFSNAEIEIHDKDGNKIEKHPIIDLLRQPTPLDSFEQWMKKYSIIHDVYSNVFIYKLQGIPSALPSALWYFDNRDLKIIPTGKSFGQTKIEEIISGYQLESTKQNYKTLEVIKIQDGVSIDKLVAESKIFSLQKNISNSNAALATRNVLIQDRGAFGMLSFTSKDGLGSTPLGKNERERIEKEYQDQYGLGFSNRTGEKKRPYNITTADAKWLPMSFPTKDLLLFEEVEEDFAMICAAYGARRDIFPSTKGATFENQSEAEKGTYQSSITPKADALARTLNAHFAQWLKEGERIVFDYSWLACMKEDEQKEATSEKIETERLSILLRDGIISPEAYAQLAEVEFTGTGIPQQNSFNLSTNGK